MSRTLHTQKLSLRAARRMARPFASRRADSARWAAQGGAGLTCEIGFPIIRRSPPVAGCLHPLTPRDVRDLARILGPECFYGIKTIRMRSESVLGKDGLVFAEYV